MHLRSINKISVISLITFFNLFNICIAGDSTLFQGIVNADKINIRSDSTVSSQIICNLNKGKRVEVVKELYDWYKIKLPKNAPSFIRSDMISAINDKTARVIKDKVNIRLKPNESSPVLGRVDKNEIINILKTRDGWYGIEPVINSFGWINKKFVDKLPSKEIFTETKTATVDNIDEAKTDKILDKIADQENIAVEGIIMPYGKFFKRQATHKLTSQDGKLFLLKGNKKSLNTFNYRKVKIVGKLTNLAKQKYPIIEISSIEAWN